MRREACKGIGVVGICGFDNGASQNDADTSSDSLAVAANLVSRFTHRHLCKETLSEQAADVQILLGSASFAFFGTVKPGFFVVSVR